MIKQCAERIISNYIKLNKKILFICDKAHIELALAIKNLSQIDINILLIESFADVHIVFQECLLNHIPTYVFIEPKTFSEFQIFTWLDFSLGSPIIADLRDYSYVSVLPIESTYRIFSSDIIKDINAKTTLLSSLKANTKYKITTKNGTEFFFTSRYWIDDGNEVLTSPYEESINGVIAVDGAFFFQPINSVIDFYIEYGKLTNVKERNNVDKIIVEQYKLMTSDDFYRCENKQLAEIGIGCNTNAIIGNCFMESEMMYGTCHFCFGNNACYGGNNKSTFHGGSILIKEPLFEEIT